MDPKARIVVPEGRYGLQAIDALDPDMVCYYVVCSKFTLHMYNIITYRR